MNNAINKYRARLASLPVPGTGCHPALLGSATLGLMAGLHEDEIFSDIRQAIP